jgi:cyclophilin family peptidyl-prolyl cis-trans isomerase
MRRLKLSVVGFLVSMIIAGCAVGATPTVAPTKPAAQSKPAPAAGAKAQAKQYAAAPAMTIDPKKKYTAVITTTKGPITVDLLTEDAPITVNNFVFLAKDGYYNGSIFHRTIKGFMIQGGDPTGTGGGSPGYRFNNEPVKRDYTRGIVAMANAGPNTNGSQFFIMHQDYQLARNYTIFGLVSRGIEVVDAIATAPVGPTNSGEMSRPVEPVQVTSVEISEQ